MMRLLSILCLLICFNFSYANTITLEDHYKVIKTFSGDIEKTNSFHLIIAKNKKTRRYEIIPFSFFDATLVRLNPFVFKKKPSIETYNSKGNVVTLVVAINNAFPFRKQVIDINFKENTSSTTDIVEDDDITTTLKNNDYAFYVTKDYNTYKVVRIKNSKTIDSIRITKTKESTSFFKNVYNYSLNSITPNDFIKKGAIDPYRVYLENNNTFCFTREDNSIKATTLVYFNFETYLKEKQYIYKSIPYDTEKKVKDAAYYFKDNKLYQLVTYKEGSGAIRITDVKTNTTKQIPLESKSLSKRSSDFDINTYISKINTSKIIPTITANFTTDNRIIIRGDYVYKDTYRYYDHSWFFHQQFLLQQQQFHNITPSFGPSTSFENFDINNDEDAHYFTIVTDRDSNVINTFNAAPKHKYIDKSSYTKPVMEDFSKTLVSSVFLKDTFVHFYLDKVSNTFKASRKTIL